MRIVMLAVVAVLAATGLYGLLAVIRGDLGFHIESVGKPRPIACTAAKPCEIRLLFAATGEASARMPEGLLERVAIDNVASLRTAFRRSGVDNVTFSTPSVLDRPIDAGRIDRVDAPAGWSDPAAFNSRMLRWLPTARAKGAIRRTNIAVIYTGLRAPDGGCYANALAGGGYVIIPGCLLDGYAADPDARMSQRVMLLHEVGHLFGAFHNDNGNPQPCSDARRFGRDPTSCAWEQCIGRTCSPQELFAAKDAFCTLVGQYNYNAGPDGRSYCRAHTGGEGGSGWILEYSHTGKCRTPGYEAYDCGDAGHDAATSMRRQAIKVARSRPRLD